MLVIPQKRKNQSGFTLVELVIAIVILGILAAVAIPKLSGTAEAAYTSVQDSTLGALKSAWGVAYSTKKATPSAADVAAAMSDPKCTAGTGTISCEIKKKDGKEPVVFTVKETSNLVESSADISLDPKNR